MIREKKEMVTSHEVTPMRVRQKETNINSALTESQAIYLAALVTAGSSHTDSMM